MALTITHSTAADATFSTEGTAAWEDEHVVTLGADDNLVTDAEKANLHAPNSDNQDLSGYSTTSHDHDGTYADLVDGLVPSNQLPSYVDDVLEYATFAAFPVTGESGKVYVSAETNVTYRWSGTAYIVIGSDLALGETSATAYRGDRGKTAYDHSQVAHAPSNAEQNVQADWNAVSGDAFIQNKPSSFTPSAHTHTGVYEPADSTILKDADIGVSVAAQHSHPYSASDHNHTGIYEPADSTILKDADIGVTVSAPHSHPYASTLGTDDNYVTDTEKSNLHAPGSDNQDLSGYSLTSHDHDGTYEPADATILKDADIGVTVSAPHSHPYASTLGTDDNYVTDAEKTKLSNLSGTNTGDQDLSGYSLTSHNHDGDYLSGARADFWSQGGLYVGTEEPPGGLVSYADWLQYGIGYFGFLNLTANAPTGAASATITPVYANGVINPVLAAYERNITAIVGTSYGDGSTFALQADVSINGNVWAAVGISYGEGSVNALAATFVGSAAATVGIAYGDGSVNNLTAEVSTGPVILADFEDGTLNGWTNVGSRTLASSTAWKTVGSRGAYYTEAGQNGDVGLQKTISFVNGDIFKVDYRVTTQDWGVGNEATFVQVYQYVGGSWVEKVNTSLGVGGDGTAQFTHAAGSGDFPIKIIAAWSVADDEGAYTSGNSAGFDNIRIE